MADRERRELTALRLSAQTISAQTISAQKISAQRIASSDFTTPADVVRHMLAMQAQDFSGARWSIGLRLPGSTDAAIESAIARREIVRSWPIRGTLHFVAPEDLGWMLAIAGPRLSTRAATRRAELGITDRELALAGELATGLLSGGRLMRRDRLLEAWEQAGIPTTGQRSYHLLWNLGHSGLIVFGPADGKQPTFALLDEWVPNPRRLEGDEALGEFATRYFRSHGPATVSDFAWWASITLRDARTGIALAQGLEERDFGGVVHYLAEGLEPAASGIHALPGFDEYMLGYQDRSAALAPEFSNRIVPGNNGVFLPTVVVNGEIVGTWKRTDGAKTVRVELTEFTSMTKRAHDGFDRALARYGAFVGKPVIR